MTALYVLAGFAGALLALAVLVWTLGYLVRSLALFLPPAGAFLGTVSDLRQPTSAQVPAEEFSAGAVPWPRARPRGVAPPPIDEALDTSASLPPSVPTADQDRWDPELYPTAAERAGSTLASPAR